MTINLGIDVVGWLGAIALLAAYILVSSKKVEGDSLLYQNLNLIGSAFLIINSGYYKAYPSAFVNIVWIIIAMVTLIRVKSKFSQPS